MTTAFVGAATAAATSLTMPSHSAGDLLLFFAGNRGSTTIPTIPGSWKMLRTRQGSGMAFVLAYCYAADSSTTSGTWTNATHTGVWGGNDSTGAIIIPGMHAGTNRSTVTAVDYLTTGSFASSYFVSFVLLNNTTTTGETAPTNMTNRSATNGGSGEIAVHDTIPAGLIAGWPTTTFTADAATSSHTVVIEIQNTRYVPPSGGGGIQIARGMHGGMR